MNIRQDATTVLEEARIAYVSGRSVDFVQGHVGGDWAAVFTVILNSVAAAEAAGKQLLRSRADRLRHIRRARLKHSTTETGLSMATRETIKESVTESVILTELPNRTQVIVALEDGRTIKVRRYLEDDALAVLQHSFMPTRDSVTEVQIRYANVKKLR